MLSSTQRKGRVDQELPDYKDRAKKYTILVKKEYDEGYVRQEGYLTHIEIFFHKLLENDRQACIRLPPRQHQRGNVLGLPVSENRIKNSNPPEGVQGG